jgi:hypothetical protein
MKYLVPFVLLLPMLSSCTEQEFYAPPPRAHVEIESSQPQRHYHENSGYRLAPIHGHSNSRNEQQAPAVHGHAAPAVHGHAAPAVHGKNLQPNNKRPLKIISSDDDVQQHGHN